MRIVVLAGGDSTEREISLISGRQVMEALREAGHEVVFVDPGSDFLSSGVLSACRDADMVFLALHGQNGEDGKIQAAFDLAGIPYTGSGPLGSALAMDKDVSKSLLRQGGVPTADWKTLRKGEEAGLPEEYGLSWPVVVKVAGGGSSVGVYICHCEDEYRDALRNAFDLEDTVLVEAYIRGREFSVGLLEGRALPVIEIAPKEGFYDYRNKYTPGSTVETCPAEIPDECRDRMQRFAERAYQVLRLGGYGRIDFMMDEEGGIFCLEANTLPGMTPTSLLPQEAKAAGLSFPELCERLILTAKKKYGSD